MSELDKRKKDEELVDLSEQGKQEDFSLTTGKLRLNKEILHQISKDQLHLSIQNE